MAALILGLHAVAGACVLVVVPGVAGVALGASVLALGAASARLRALLRAPSSVRAMELHGNLATVEFADGRRIAAPVTERRYVSRLAVSVSLKAPLRRTVLVSRDMLSADLFRLLRIWALWGKLPAVAGKQLPG
jgi:hypothetical protein